MVKFNIQYLLNSNNLIAKSLISGPNSITSHIILIFMVILTLVVIVVVYYIVALMTNGCKMANLIILFIWSFTIRDESIPLRPQTFQQRRFVFIQQYWAYFDHLLKVHCWKRFIIAIVSTVHTFWVIL